MLAAVVLGFLVLISSKLLAYLCKFSSLGAVWAQTQKEQLVGLVWLLLLT
jgi:hypothetical protein